MEAHAELVCRLLKAGAFVAASTGLILFSRTSLRAVRSHGFYRLFAWECMLALLLLNVETWFTDPFSPRQLFSWMLLFGSLVPLCLGVAALRTQGRPVAVREGEPQLLAFERTSILVTGGIYHYIRHPLYSSLLLLDWGIFLKRPGWPGLLLALAATGLLWLTARADERECLHHFGPAYQVYLQKTRARFLPYLF